MLHSHSQLPSRKYNKDYKAFTLIELLITVILISLLAAIILPRLADLRSSAYISQVSATAGNFRAAVNVVHSRWLAEGFSGPADNFDAWGNGQVQIDINNKGWPAQSYPGIETNPQTNNKEDCISLWRAILNSHSDLAGQASSEQYQATYDSSNSGTCIYLLVKEPGLSITYDSINGKVSSDLTI